MSCSKFFPLTVVRRDPHAVFFAFHHLLPGYVLPVVIRGGQSSTEIEYLGALYTAAITIGRNKASNYGIVP
jgi:hypothetical protein